MHFRPWLIFSQLSLGILLGANAVCTLAAGNEESAKKGGELMRRPYQYYANGDSASKAIENFSKNFGLILKARLNYSSRLNGRIGGESAFDFIQQLSQTQGFQWFLIGKELYISDKSDFVTKAVAVSPGSADSIQKALTDIKVLDSEFGWGSIPEENVVLLSGPSQYVDIVAKHIGQLSQGYQNQVHIFKLKYANVDDRVYQYRDKEIQTPGVATLLKRIADVSVQQNRKSSTANRFESTAATGNGNEASQLKASASSMNEKALNISNGVRVESDARLNAIIIKDHPSQIPLWDSLIRQLDVPSQLVEIEASILEIESSKFSDLGVDFSYGSSRLSFNSVQANQSNLPNAPLSDANLGIGRGSSVLVNDLKGFNARIRALESAGDAKTLASPSILTTDNLGAFLDLTQTFYSRVEGERVANLIPVTAGTTLRVTPHIINEPDGVKIQLILDIEDGGLSAPGDQGQPPLVRRTNISTQALVREGQSLLIGGYNLDSTEKNNTKVPLLGDIPLLGSLFSGMRNTSNSRKRLFLISPRIIKDEGGLISDPKFNKSATLLPSAPTKLLRLSPALSLPNERNINNNTR